MFRSMLTIIRECHEVHGKVTEVYWRNVFQYVGGMPCFMCYDLLEVCTVAVHLSHWCLITIARYNNEDICKTRYACEGVRWQKERERRRLSFRFCQITCNRLHFGTENCGSVSHLLCQLLDLQSRVLNCIWHHILKDNDLPSPYLVGLSDLFIRS